MPSATPSSDGSPELTDEPAATGPSEGEKLRVPQGVLSSGGESETLPDCKQSRWTGGARFLTGAAILPCASGGRARRRWGDHPGGGSRCDRRLLTSALRGGGPV